MTDDKRRSGGGIIRRIKRHVLILLLLLGALFFAGSSVASAKTAVAAAKTVKGGKWVTSSKGKKYRYANKKYAKNVWLKIGGSIYRIDENGYLDTGWIAFDGNLYFAGKNGKLYMKKWVTQAGNKYYLQANGVCARNKWGKIGGKYYYFQDNWKMAQNQLVTTNGKTYYVKKTGVRVKSMWVKIDGRMYYFNRNGVALKNTWAKQGKKLYYLGSNGASVVNQWVGNYYVGADGLIKKSCVVDGYYLNSAGKKVGKVFSGDFIFVGDSRMEGMKLSVTDSRILYIAEGGMGYDWLKETAGPDLMMYLNYKPKVKVVLALGINDYPNIQLYINYYKALVKKYPNTEFYMMSVNPVDEEKEALYGYKIPNSGIQEFNRKMSAAFPSRYVNTYQQMVDMGFETRDGVHYTVTDYQEIYRMLMSKIGSYTVIS